ncbi:MAG: hypothetical protein IKL47_07845 [Clostridia bacterium]|nr:hypothetical protein [Clostridia bacterium]
MAEYVKKTPFGYKEVQGGYSSSEWEYAIVPRKEYNEQELELRLAKSGKSEAEEKARKNIDRANAEAKREINEAYKAADEQVEKINRELGAANAEIEYQRGLNENLLRINRERANAARKIKPKKEHNGYLIDFSKEYEYRYRVGKEEKRVMLWETIIESPYGVKFSDEQAREQIQSELFNNSDWAIGKIGIDAQWLIGYEKMIAKKEYKENYINKNVVVRQQLRANYSRGYWEIILLHTKPLCNVPDDMMRCNYS